MLLPALLSAGPAVAAPVPSDPGDGSAHAHGSPSEAQRWFATKRAGAFAIDFFAPFYSTEGGRDTMVFVMNRITDPIVVELAARSGGEELALGAYPIEPRQHIELSLRELLFGLGSGHAAGSLRLSLLGDEDTVQAWAVVSEPRGAVFEVPFKTPGAATAREHYAFWDAAALGVAGPEPIAFHFLNTSERELSVSLVAGNGPRGDDAILKLQPGEAVAWRGSGGFGLGRQGWLRVAHDGEPGNLAGVGVLGGERPLGTVPLVPRGEVEYRRSLESLPLAVERGDDPEAPAAADGWINLLSVAEERQEVLVETLDAGTGAVLARTSIAAAPFEVVRVPLARLLPRGGRSSEPVRLRFEGEARGLAVQGSRALRDGSVAELPIFGAYHGHGSGIYPLPDNRRFDVVTTVVNAGPEEARIGAQVTWAGGVFALEPITVPPGASREIDLDALAQESPADLAGRPLEAHRPGAVLQWLVLSGGSQLLGRTVVRPRGGQNRFGFNCFGCCHQWPSGTVVPGEVEFFTGQTPSFQTAVTFTTCMGTTGPFPTGFTSLSVPWPFSWNGQNVGATDPAQEFLVFEGFEIQTDPGCNEFTVNTMGVGRASTCRQHLRKDHNPAASWDPSKSCTSQLGDLPPGQRCGACYSCCGKIREYNLCREVNEDIANSEYGACTTHCLTDQCV